MRKASGVCVSPGTQYRGDGGRRDGNDVDDQSRVVFLGGPTGVGKTAVGVALARRLNGEIVSCDAMQVYRGIDIATNKPSPEERAVAHHVIDCIDPNESFDVVRYRDLALAATSDILSRGKVPLVVGGTGLYMRVLLDGIFDQGRVPVEVRRALEEKGAADGGDALYRELVAADPVAATAIHPHNVKRVIRALEVFYARRRPISELWQERSGLWGRHKIFMFALTMPRSELYNKINERVEVMVRQGLVDEIRRLDGCSLSPTAQAIIGVKEIRRFLRGESTLEAAAEEMKRNTRHLAKRQWTWFRAEKRIEWIERGGADASDLAASRIAERIERGSERGA